MERIEGNILMGVTPEDWDRVFSRPDKDNDVVRERVSEILLQIKSEGDSAVLRLTQQIDGGCFSSESLMVSPLEIEAASERLPDSFKDAIEVAYSNIEKFHSAQLRPTEEVETLSGVVCSRRRVAIERVGLYIPGGSAPLFSTVLMSAIPARLAGCSSVVMATPSDAQGRIADEILYCARVCGVDTIYKLGGAIAVGALAYGTESIERVDKIFGPGNRYLTYAKESVSTKCVAIDIPAGPSEVMVVGDHTSRESFVAADLLSQLEHGGDSQAIAVVTSLELAHKVASELRSQAAQLSRSEILGESMHNCLIIVEEDMEVIQRMVDYYAPEHLIVSLEDADGFASRVRNAGSVFIGNFSPESVGDYASGTNHTLPTSGWAKSFSGVCVDSFSKYITYQKLTQQGLASIAPTVETMARHEGLTAHANAVRVRLER
ncbi:MAG: histidinol dehydrogenase [Rikenellaceae bacterium]